MFSPRVFCPGEGRSTRVTDMGKGKKAQREIRRQPSDQGSKPTPGS
ncbi:unnamed protein product [Ectocarpus sp. 6 AP-2014]